MPGLDANATDHGALRCFPIVLTIVGFTASGNILLLSLSDGWWKMITVSRRGLCLRPDPAAPFRGTAGGPE